MKVVIAEKPSVALTIGKAIGANIKKNGYFEGNGYRVTWNFGHLFELYQAEKYDSNLKKWAIDTLPIIPEKFKYQIREDAGCKKQFSIIKQLFNDSKTTEIINAGDAGREGELIFRLSYLMSGSKKPVKRLWLSSMEELSIKKEFNNLKDGKQFNNLYYCALARQHADWLIGINGTRYFSLKSNEKGVKKLGRVMTPTLNMIVLREREIKNFKIEDYYKVVAIFNNEETNQHYYAYSNRIDEKSIADALCNELNNKNPLLIKNIKDEEKRIKQPHLYDLTSLQKDASKYFGLTAEETLESAQNLYEKKLSTYPRTDSNYLTDDMEQTAFNILRKCESVFKDIHNSRNNTPNIAHHLNTEKVSDHYAIIPTSNLSIDQYDALEENDKKVYSLIIERVIEAFDDYYIYKSKSIDYEYKNYQFKAIGKTDIKLGWKGKQLQFKRVLKADEDKPRDVNADKTEQNLPNLKIGCKVIPIKSAVKACKTTPPQHYTEASLLTAMEYAGSKETDKEAERKGLGTPATRAEIIEKLVKDKYILRDKKRLLPTESGIKLIASIPERYKSPLLTAEWENKMVLIKDGKFTYKQFINEIIIETSNLIKF